jgi:hypothetical protein
MDTTATTNCSTPCYDLSHRCCDCAAHVIPTYNELGEINDHDCPSPSSNY